MQYCKNVVFKRKMELIIWLKQNPHPRWNPKSTHFTSVCFTKVKTTIVKTRFMRKMEKQIVVLPAQNQQPRKGHQSQVCVLLRQNGKIGKSFFVKNEKVMFG